MSAAKSLERLRLDGATFMEEITREYYLALAGHKAAPALTAILQKYAYLSSPEAVALAREGFENASNGEQRNQLRALLEWVVDKSVRDRLASIEERVMEWEGKAMVTLPTGDAVQFERSSIEMANESDRARRLAIASARDSLMEGELAPMRQEMLHTELEMITALGISEGYNSTWEELSGIDLGALRRQCEDFLQKTQAMWDEVFPEFVKRGLNIDPEEATRADALRLFRAQGFDAYFPAAEMEARVQKQVREMGLDPLAGGHVILDTEERLGKRGRAFCSPVRVPDEVYLVLRPHGGQTDWSTFLHELGHALHFGYTSTNLPFEFRILGDYSVTESYAMLFDGLLEHRGWVERYTDLVQPRVQEFLRAAAFQELHFVRRYCGKLLYESQLYGGDVPWSALPDLYTHELRRATNFIYSPAEAFIDVDSSYYSSRYLRAWQLQSLLDVTLTEKFDEDWWRNPRAGPWIVNELFSRGQSELADQLAARVSGAALSFNPLISHLERLLS
jgi:hypothetical protein